MTAQDEIKQEDAKSETEETQETAAEPTVEELKAQLADSQKRIKELNHESAERRKKLDAFEKAEADRKTAEMSEMEKVNAKAKEIAEEKDRLARENRVLTLQRDFENRVRDAKLEFKNSLASQDAFRALLELVGEENEVTADHVKVLAKEREYLFGKNETVTSSNDAGARGRQNIAALSQEQVARKKQTISPL